MGRLMGYPRRSLDRLFLVLWNIALHLVLVPALLYLWRRARKEALYSHNLGERFGGGAAVEPGSVWVHAVSLGELRAARPLIDELLTCGTRVLITNMTAAGRAEAEKLFAGPIVQGQVAVRWSPVDLSWSCARFLRRHRPALGIIMEIELWPQMIASANLAKVPLVLAQAQYPEKSFIRDQNNLGLRAHLVQGLTLVLAKSERHAARFRKFGAPNVEVMGELRFEQPIPQKQLAKAETLRHHIAPNRPVFCLASTAPDEDDLLIPVLARLKHEATKSNRPQPFFVYVPRHPRSFDRAAAKLVAAGLTFARRSSALDVNLTAHAPLPEQLDGLFGDSLGEIYFYLALSDGVFIGDSLNDEGSHNIIEPLSVGKHVVVGPSIWGIEYPAVEALAAGVITQINSSNELVALWGAAFKGGEVLDLPRFMSMNAGATKRAVKLMKSAKLLSD